MASVFFIQCERPTLSETRLFMLCTGDSSQACHRRDDVSLSGVLGTPVGLSKGSSTVCFVVLNSIRISSSVVQLSAVLGVVIGLSAPEVLDKHYFFLFLFLMYAATSVSSLKNH